MPRLGFFFASKRRQVCPDDSGQDKTSHHLPHPPWWKGGRGSGCASGKLQKLECDRREKKREAIALLLPTNYSVWMIVRREECSCSMGEKYQLAAFPIFPTTSAFDSNMSSSSAPHLFFSSLPSPLHSPLTERHVVVFPPSFEEVNTIERLTKKTTLLEISSEFPSPTKPLM